MEKEIVIPQSDTLPGTGTIQVEIYDNGPGEIPAVEIKEPTPNLRDSGSPGDKASTPQEG